MLSCEDYEGTYVVNQTSCPDGCTIPKDSTIVVACEPTTFTLNGQKHEAHVNLEGQLVVPGLGVVASITDGYLFGVAGSMAMEPATEVWGAEQG